MTDKKRKAALTFAERPPRPLHETVPMMVNDISHLFFSKVRAMEPEGVMSQHSARVILRILNRCDGMRQSELAREAHLSAPTVSATLRRMENEGLIFRREDEQDGRAIGVYLTDKGRAHDAAVRHMLRQLDDVLMQGFTADEIGQLTAMLHRMRENILQNLKKDAVDEEGTV